MCELEGLEEEIGDGLMDGMVFVYGEVVFWVIFSLGVWWYICARAIPILFQSFVVVDGV